MHAITLSGVLFLWMHTLTFVKSRDCTLDEFVSGGLYDANFDISNLEATYTSGKQVRVSCKMGYTGFFKLICSEEGWLSKGQKCQPRPCGHPGDAPFGEFRLESGDDLVFGSKVIYTCHKGYQMMSRTNFRRCMAEGWDGVVPICEALKCPRVVVADNIQVTGNTEEASYNSVIRFRCTSRSDELQGPSEIFCNENGQWNAEPPRCQPISCAVPTIENGRARSNVQTYKEDEILHFDCNRGFQRTDGRPSTCLKAGTRAEWQPMPSCEPIKCRLPLTRPEGTNYVPYDKNVFLPGEEVRVTCTAKRWIFNTRTTTTMTRCNEDGAWSTSPVCKEVICERNAPHVAYFSGFYQVKLDESVSYSCSYGYRKSNRNNVALCTREGWKPDPLCEAITCARRDIANAVIENGKDEYSFREKAQYVCKDGYEGGPFELKCEESGWSGTGSCKLNCKRLEISNAHIRFNDKQSYEEGERVDYVCTNSNNQVFSIVCGQGQWSGVQSCSECPRAQVPNGVFVGPYDDKLYYACNDGYKLITKGWWGNASCVDGIWSGLEMCIESSKCRMLPAIPNGQATSGSLSKYHGNGDSASITCKAGYHAKVQRLECRDGKWSSDGVALREICEPVAKLCDPPPKVDNAVVETSYKKKFSSGSAVSYICRKNYESQGIATITCDNGTWDASSIKCAATPSTAPPQGQSD